MIQRSVATRITIIVILMLMPVLGFVGGVALNQRPALILRDVREADGVVIRGGWMDLEFRLKRVRDCDAHVERWLWQDLPNGGRQWVPLAPVSNPPTTIGVEAHYTLSIPVPGDIQPGEWHYFSRTRDECASPLSLTRQVVRDSPDVPVRVIDPPLQRPVEVVVPPGPITVLPLPK